MNQADVAWANLCSYTGVTPRKPGSGPKNPAIWETEDGRRIRICDMEDRHLLNAIRYTQRRLPDLDDDVDDCWNLVGDCRGEGAACYAEQTAFAAMDRRFAVSRALDALIDEAEQRGLKGGK